MADLALAALASSNSCQVKKTVSYAESSDDEDEDVFQSIRSQRSRPRAARRAVPDDDDDDAYEAEENVVEEEDDGTIHQTPHIVVILLTFCRHGRFCGLRRVGRPLKEEETPGTQVGSSTQTICDAVIPPSRDAPSI